MYITLKRIGKISSVLVLRILLICKFLNFTAIFTKKKKDLHTTFCVRKLILVKYIQLILRFIAYKKKFAKLRAFRAYVPYVPSCLSALRALNYYMSACLRSLNYCMSTCPHFLCTYVPM